jgi:GNAT superfamily N-acetyltransferase
MNMQDSNFQYRLFSARDIDRLPTRCQGDPDEIRDRISRIGASAMMVFDGQKHIGQLQFRPYVPNTVSPAGLYDPLYWMDFQDYATPDLPRNTLALFCYHVGQTDNTQDRDPHYFGKGIGLSLLDKTLEWAESAGFEAVIAKGCPGYRPIIEFMGGMPSDVYRKKGFKIAAVYVDQELRSIVERMNWECAPEKASEISVCIRYFS